MQSQGTEQLERLIDAHQSMVFSIAWRMTGDRGLAEEIAQDVFLELDRNLGRLEDEDHARHWLRRVAVSRSTDALRRRKVRRLDAWVELNETHASSGALNESVLGARVEELLAGLPEAHRSAIVLRYQEDLTAEEIAEMQQTPVATVKSWLQRGLKQLRVKASEELGEFVRRKASPTAVRSVMATETAAEWGTK